MKPTVGRIVHYYELAYGAVPYGPFAAIVTAVPEDADFITLSVMKPGEESMIWAANVREKTSPESVTDYWEWPPRE